MSAAQGIAAARSALGALRGVPPLPENVPDRLDWLQSVGNRIAEDVGHQVEMLRRRGWADKHIRAFVAQRADALAGLVAMAVKVSLAELLGDEQ